MTAFATDLCTPVALRENSFKYLPESSDDLPVLDIEEGPPKNTDPGPEDRNPTRLKAKLGIDYKQDFMSVEEPDLSMHPEEINSPSIAEVFRNRRPSRRMPSWIKKINLDSVNKGRHPVPIGRKQKRKFQLWLWQKTDCPVIYKWKNIGHRFWPPWIKVGTCDKNRQCSLPAGMGCQPKSSTMITILRWHCQGISEGRIMEYCTWIKVKYPIISECKCKCS